MFTEYFNKILYNTLRSYHCVFDKAMSIITKSVKRILLMVAVWQQFMLAFLYNSYNSLLIIAFKKQSGSITMYRLIGLNV